VEHEKPNGEIGKKVK